MSSQTTANDTALSRVRDLLPLIREQAAVVEATGTLNRTVVEALREAELVLCGVPREFGGGGADIVGWLQTIEEMSVADGSIGWSYMANSCAVTNAVGFLPAAATERMFADGLPLVAGMLAPRGSALSDGDGFTISGDYQFGSGIGHAEWIGAGVFVREDGKVRKTASGKPDMRAF